jgi:hypothetical protein
MEQFCQVFFYGIKMSTRCHCDALTAKNSLTNLTAFCFIDFQDLIYIESFFSIQNLNAIDLRFHKQAFAEEYFPTPD